MVNVFRKSLIDRFYAGKGAEQYEEKRNRSGKWRFEEESLKTLFHSVPDSEVEKVADMPVGTNRFASFLQSLDAVHRVYCVDLSIDMLAQAMNRQEPKQVFLRHDVVRSPPNLTCDTTISFRFLNLFSFDETKKILKNMAAVTKKNMFLSVRLADDSANHGDVLAGKVYLHGHAEFHGLISEIGFAVKTEFHYPDKKGGRYYVLHAVRDR